MSDDRKKTKKVKFRVAGLETPNGRLRVQKAQEKFFDACHESHHALIKLVDFLDSSPFRELIKTIADEFGERNALPGKQWIYAIMEQYMRILEEARNIREQTSNINEELQRAIVNMPPQELGNPRILCE